MRKILSVDDDPNILSIFEVALERMGYQVFVTTDPLAVAKLLDDHKIDLIMLDICMPKKSGFEIFKELKKKYAALPILFVTGYPQAFDMQNNEVVKMWTEDFSDGNTDILYKPFDVNSLCQKVESLIGKANGGEA